MTKEQFLNEAKELLDDLYTTLEKKNKDYTGGSDNPFENFEMAKTMFDIDPKLGLLLRVSDKIQRIKSFIANGKLENESVKDAVSDVIGYMVILNGMLQNDQVLEAAKEVTEEHKDVLKKLTDKNFNKLEEGCYYQSSCGNVYGPMYKRKTEPYEGQWGDQDHLGWDDYGNDFDKESEHHFVKKITKEEYDKQNIR